MHLHFPSFEDRRPSYLFGSLKDANGLVKMYGMINVERYQLVATGDSIQACLSKYKDLLRSSGSEIDHGENERVSGSITDIRETTKEGSTYYYIQLNNKNVYYSLNVIDNEEVVLLDIGDRVTLDIDSGFDGKIIPASLRR